MKHIKAYEKRMKAYEKHMKVYEKRMKAFKSVSRQYYIGVNHKCPESFYPIFLPD